MASQTMGGARGMGLGVVANEWGYGIECVGGLSATSERLCVTGVANKGVWLSDLDGVQ